MLAQKTKNAAVQVGQIWKDNDKRSSERYLRVVEVSNSKAHCERVVPDQTGAGGWRAVANLRKSQISVERFKPTATGYALVEGFL